MLKLWLKNWVSDNFSFFLIIFFMAYKFYYLNWTTGYYINTSIFLSIGFLFLITSFVLILPASKRFLPLFIFDFIITFILFADIIYFRYYTDFISAASFTQVGLIGPVFDSVLSLLKISDLILIADFVFFVPLIKLQSRFLARINNGIVKKKLLFRGVTAIAVIYLGYFLMYANVSMFDTNNRMMIINNAGVLFYHAYDVKNYVDVMASGHVPMTDEEKLMVMNRFKKAKEQDDLTKKHLYGEAKGLNLIMVQVEALQDYVLGLKINGQEITPNLNHLLKESIYFRNFYSQTAQGNTSDAEFIANVSLYPLNKGSVFFLNTHNHYRSLPNVLKDMGYTTQVLHANDAEYWNRKFMYPALGIDKFYSENDFEIDNKIGLGLSDRSFLNQAVEKIKAAPKPVFSFPITLTSHFPFHFPKELQELKLGNLKGSMAGDYLESIHYVDKALGEFFGRLQEENLLENSMIVIYGDHFAMPLEEMSEIKGLLPEAKQLEVERLKVPLIIRLPGGEGTGVKSIPGGQVDIFPTLANLLGVSDKDIFPLGRDLLNSEEGFVVFRNEAYIDEKNRFHSVGETDNQDVKKVKRELKISDLIIQEDMIPELISRRSE